MFCSNCGSKLPEGARFCSVCGAKVLEAVRVDSESTPLDFSDLPGAEAESKPAEAPVKTRVTFDWSNVIDEPQKRTVQDIKSPWSTTGSVDEREIAAEIKPSTDRSRTMSFIDVLKAEKEQAEAVKSIEETLAEDSKIEERPIIYTEVLDPGYLDGLGEEETEAKPPELHIPPLYEDLDQPVVTPFDDMEEVPAEAPAEEPAVVEIPAAEFELPVSEEPEFEEPAVEEPVAEEPETEVPEIEEPAEEVAEEPVFEEPEFEEPAAEEPVIEEPAAEAPENTHWFELPDFLKPREGETPFASIDEAPAEEIAEEPETEEPAEEPATEELNMDDYLVEPEFEEPEFEEFEPEAPAFEEPVIEEPEFEEPAAEEPETEEPVCEEPELDEMEVTEPEIEEPAVEEPVYEEPELDYLAEEPAAEEPEIAEIEEPVAEEPQDDEDINALFTNAEDEYLDISTERGTVTRSTISFDPEEYDDEDEVDEEPEVFEEPAAEEPEEEPAAEETAVDEESLFAEIEEEAPKKTGMTIAAPADKESEIEALKKRLAELMGTDWEEPQAIEKEDKLELEDLIDEPEEVSSEDEYLNISDEDLAVEEPEVELPEVEEPEIEVPEVEEPEIELPEVEEPEIEVPEVEEPEIEIPEIEIPALEEEVPAVEEPEIELPEIEEEIPEEEPAEKKPASIDDYLAAILEQEAAPVVAASEITAQEHDLGGTLDEYLEVPAAEEPAAEEPAEEPEFELPEIEGEVPSVELPAEEPEFEIPEFEGEIPSVELPAEEPEEIEIPAIEEAAPEAEEAVPEVKESDALTIEELEKDIFGNQPSEDARAEETKKIDKFYTLYRKNEEFQRLLDEEYNKLKAAGGPAPEQILPDPEPPATAAKNGKMIEDATIYQEFEIPAEALAEAEAKAKEARENAPVKFEKDDGKVAAAVAGAAAAGIASTAKKAEKENDVPEVEYEEVDKGGGCLTALAVIIAILLVILLAIILLLNFAPDSGISIKIDSFIENITSHFTAVEVIGKQILL